VLLFFSLLSSLTSLTVSGFEPLSHPYPWIFFDRTVFLKIFPERVRYSDILTFLLDAEGFFEFPGVRADGNSG